MNIKIKLINQKKIIAFKNIKFLKRALNIHRIKIMEHSMLYKILDLNR